MLIEKVQELFWICRRKTQQKSQKAESSILCVVLHFKGALVLEYNKLDKAVSGLSLVL